MWEVQPRESLLLAPSPLYPSDRFALPWIMDSAVRACLQEPYSLRWASFCLNCEASFIPHLLPTGISAWTIFSMLICHCARRGPLRRSTPLCLAPSSEPRVLTQQSTGLVKAKGVWGQGWSMGEAQGWESEYLTSGPSSALSHCEPSGVSLPVSEPSMSACR